MPAQLGPQFSRSVVSNSLQPHRLQHASASLSINNSRSLLKLMSIESVMPSNHLILYHTLLLPPSIFPRIRVFSNESVLRGRWPKYCSFCFSVTSSVLCVAILYSMCLLKLKLSFNFNSREFPGSPEVGLGAFTVGS